LCLNAGDDEAFAWLQFSEALANLPALLTARWTPRVYFVLSSILLLAGILPRNQPRTDVSWFQEIGAFAVYWFFYLSLAYWIVLVVTIPFAFLFRGLTQGLGCTRLPNCSCRAQCPGRRCAVDM
jgi:hypothetical protein